MAIPDFNPISTSNKIILPATGNTANVVQHLPLGIYSNSQYFISGAADQVAFTYKMLGGDVLDLEITEGAVYAAYESAVLEYSYIVNLHQAKNSLGSLLGSATGTFNHDGQIIAGDASGSNASLKFPKLIFSYARRFGEAVANEIGIGGNIPHYSASIDLIEDVQDYDLQAAISSSAWSGGKDYSAAVTGSNGAKIKIHKVFYKSPVQSWRFFGYYGGLSVVGNLSSYGQYADDSSFDVVPVWENKLQAMAYENNLYTRTSHYSYQLINNKIRLFPIPQSNFMKKLWFTFSIDNNSPLDEENSSKVGVSGVNNLNTLPFENLPYESINTMGKQWIRRYAHAIAKGILSNARGKLGSIPILGGEVTLNADSLLQQSTEEMKDLREELKNILDELTYVEISKKEAETAEAAINVKKYLPKSIFVG
jgi:hypothetical protein